MHNDWPMIRDGLFAGLARPLDVIRTRIDRINRDFRAVLDTERSNQLAVTVEICGDLESVIRGRCYDDDPESPPLNPCEQTDPSAIQAR